jgi:hypothetical protein
MKWILILITTALSGVSVAQQDVEPALVKANKINTKVEMWYRYNIDGTLNPIGKKHTFELYNEDGQLIKKVKYIPDHGIEYTRTNKYTSSGKISSTITKNGNDQIVDKLKHSFSNGKIKSTKHITSGINYTTSRSYKGDNLVSQIKKDNDGMIKFNKALSYDSLGRLSDETYKAKKQYKTGYTYNELDLVDTEMLYIDSVFNYQIKYVYDDKKRKVSEEKIDHLGRSIFTLTYTYNNIGEVGTIIQTSAYLRQSYKRWVYKYAAKGKVEEIIMYDTLDGPPVSKTKYVYRLFKDL